MSDTVAAPDRRPRRPLPPRARARPGRHGHRLPRRGPEARPQGRHQGPASRARAPSSAPSASSPRSRPPPACSTRTSCGLIDSRRGATASSTTSCPSSRARRSAPASPARSSCPSTTRCASTTEVAGALEFAHKRGVVHRDIKPENILLQDGQALVADFGIALAVQQAGGSRMTQTGMSLGTPAYMSPEQAMGERDIGARSDVYALGAMTYEMLTGEPPFTGAQLPGHRREGADGDAAAARVPSARRCRRRRARGAHRAAEAPRRSLRHGEGLRRRPRRKRRNVRGHHPPARPPACAPFAPVAPFAPRPAGRRRPHRHRRGLRAGSCADARAPRPPASGWCCGSTRAARSHRLAEACSRPRRRSPPTDRASSTPTPSTAAASSCCASCGTSASRADRGHRRWRIARSSLPTASGSGTSRPMAGSARCSVDGGGSITIAEDANSDPDVRRLAGRRHHRLRRRRCSDLKQVSADGGASSSVRRTARSVAGLALTLSPLPGSRGFLHTSCPGNCAIESARVRLRFRGRQRRGCWCRTPPAPGTRPTGHLLYTDRAGGLYAAGFDPKRLVHDHARAVPVIEDVVPTTLALSAVGNRALLGRQRAERQPSELVWVSRDGSSAHRSTRPGAATSTTPPSRPTGRPSPSACATVRPSSGSGGPTARGRSSPRRAPSTGGRPGRPTAGPSRSSPTCAAAGARTPSTCTACRSTAARRPSCSCITPSACGRRSCRATGSGSSSAPTRPSAVPNIRGRRLDGDTALVPLVTDQGHQHAGRPCRPTAAGSPTSSDATGRFEVYVTPFPGMQLDPPRLDRRRQRAALGPQRPGAVLQERGRLMAVDVTARGRRSRPGRPARSFRWSGYRAARNRPQYDVAPDDRRFLMIREFDDDSGQELVYVENWFPELMAEGREERR